LKIIGLTGAGEHRFGSSLCLLRALRQIGHDVFIVGASYSGDSERDKKNVDLLIADRPYPHFYDYKEIIGLAPWTPDVMFALDPRGAFRGEKPKDVLTCFYGPDPHRAGAFYMSLIQEGQYDMVFIGQGAYKPFFVKCAPLVEVVWQAIDPERFPEEVTIEPDCDISFVGHTGIGTTKEILSGQRYSGQPPSYDYAERAEFLLRLKSDFSVKIYDHVWETPQFSLAIQRGKLGFNRSVLHDIPLRVFEVMAAGRPIVTDWSTGAFPYYMQGADSIFIYPSFYRPFYENFNVEYGFVKQLISRILDNPKRKEWGRVARDQVLTDHTWKNRAEQVALCLERGI